MPSAKIQAIKYGILSALAEVMAHVANIPPEQQTKYIGMIVEVMPEHYRGAIGLILKVGGRAAGFYALYCASHSGAPAPLPPPAPPAPPAQ